MMYERANINVCEKKRKTKALHSFNVYNTANLPVKHV